MPYPAAVPLSRKELALIEKSVQYVKDRFPRKITEWDLAAESGMTIRKIQAGFKQRTGFTVYQFQLFLKLEKAKALLRKPGYSIKRVAEETGFSSQTRFGEFFKELTGETPTDYKVAGSEYRKTPKNR